MFGLVPICVRCPASIIFRKRCVFPCDAPEQDLGPLLVIERFDIDTFEAATNPSVVIAGSDQGAGLARSRLVQVDVGGVLNVVEHQQHGQIESFETSPGCVNLGDHVVVLLTPAQVSSEAGVRSVDRRQPFGGTRPRLVRPLDTRRMFISALHVEPGHQSERALVAQDISFRQRRLADATCLGQHGARSCSNDGRTCRFDLGQRPVKSGEFIRPALKIWGRAGG